MSVGFPLFDFTGIPVGYGVAAAVPSGSSQAGGRRPRFSMARLMLQAAKDRLRENQLSDRIKTERVKLISMKLAEERALKDQDDQHKMRAAMAVLLTEI